MRFLVWRDVEEHKLQVVAVDGVGEDGGGGGGGGGGTYSLTSSTNKYIR